MKTVIQYQREAGAPFETVQAEGSPQSATVQAVVRALKASGAIVRNMELK